MKIIGLSIILLLLNSCSSTDSDNIKTKGIYANYQLKILNNSTAIETSLQSGGFTGTYLDLTSEDTLIVEVNGKEGVLKRDRGLLNQIYYEGVLKTNEPNTEVKIIFSREESDEKLVSSISLPDKLVISSGQNKNHSLDDTVIIKWKKSSVKGTKINIDSSISCYNENNNTGSLSDRLDLADNGQYSISLKSLYEDFKQDKNCEVTINVTRYKKGTIDSRFGSGDMRAFHSQKIKITIK